MIYEIPEFKKYIESVEKYCKSKNITEENFDELLENPEIDKKMEYFYEKSIKLFRILSDEMNYFTVLIPTFEKYINNSEYKFVLETMYSKI